jgi:hypothetical protein
MRTVSRARDANSLYPLSPSLSLYLSLALSLSLSLSIYIHMSSTFLCFTLAFHLHTSSLRTKGRGSRPQLIGPMV